MKIFCKDCNHDDEVWFRDILPHMIEIEEICAANGYEFAWLATLPHIELVGKLEADSTIRHENKMLDNSEKS